ncbi:acyl-CoA carboxylase subunit beta [Phycicoccus endophyticus]|uniref:Acyl-CoA carboxylase subunit beta n=1 Tax=Phycicoccus endophyticus TaxID=1690220 RepID=A0A7G9R2Z5_9MICO|nr:acyl-CoA carboxylase subunit beta [Phycicoccus endophyticus]NHI20261.1 acyl-CoA carboxylase subunit beta [Phycicoccus endophyticus]QNN49970.1 acyl-CoA carboxylase subunit beta [Phycicoccus endophyticus]GGL29187.1 propionyl-CoA carboxylase subunit beta [Phycicoccus endophyticus]
MSDTDPRVADVRARLEAAHAASAAPSERAAAKLADQGKLYVRERVALLLDDGSFVEDGRYANARAAGLPADGVVTGRGTVEERPVVVIANDPTVKAGSWGARTVEKIVRATEAALREELPVFWLVDSAGARITDQVEMFPGRRGAGHIFHNQVALSGKVPQVCCLFGPSAAGGAYIPSFCDVVIMVEGNASMYLGSPRMAEMVVGEHVSLEEMGGARMHCTVSGVGDLLAADDAEAIELARLYFSYLPDSWRSPLPTYHPEEPVAPLSRATVPERESQPFDVHELIEGLVDAHSFFEVKPLFAPELVVGFARMAGESVGIVANNSAVKGGVLFSDSADKAARFIWLCDAFSVPLLYLADVPGFMIGSEVERAGIIRHGAKMVSAVASATVPQLCVVVRKAYGAGLYAMGGPGFEPDATLALPTARIAVMGPQAAVNAVYANRIAEVEAAEGEQARADFVAARRAEYLADVDLERLAADLVVDQVLEAEDLRAELLRRLRYAARRERHGVAKRRDVPPV